MSNIEIDGLDNVDITEPNLEVITGLDSINVLYDNSALVDVDPHEYYLTSAGIYTGRVESNVPIWIADYVSDQLNTNTVLDTNPIINTLKGRLDTAELGISQNLQSIQTTNTSLSALETTLVSRLDDNEAGIADLQLTRVTADEALTIATNLQVSTFGTDVEAYITGITSTYASNNLAYTSDYDLLVASLNGVSATVTTNSEALVSQYENPDWTDDGSQTDPDIYGEPRWIYEPRAKHSLEVNADGNIAGFIAEADGTRSSFEILADEFKVSNGATKLPIFTVDTTPGSEHVSFNSNVTISGALLTTGTAWVGGNIKSTNYDWNSGNPVGFSAWTDGDPDSGEGYNIIGGKIYGGRILSQTIAYNGESLEAENYPNNLGKRVSTRHADTNISGITGFIDWYALGEGYSNGVISHGPGYSTGYLPSRILSISNSRVLLNSTMNIVLISTATSQTATAKLSLLYRINTGSWVVINEQSVTTDIPVDGASIRHSVGNNYILNLSDTGLTATDTITFIAKVSLTSGTAIPNAPLTPAIDLDVTLIN